MDMYIGQKGLVSQLGVFEKPRILVVLIHLINFFPTYLPTQLSK